MSVKIAVKRLHHEAVLPWRANPGDAGYDLHALEDGWVDSGHRALFKTGIAVAIPEGYVGIVKPRSGLAVRYGLNVLAGVIDSGYRGDVGVVLHNSDMDGDYQVTAGERIAQLVVVPVPAVEFTEVTELPDTVRGDGGFGSTGVL